MPRKRVEAKRVKHNGRIRWRVIIPKELNGGTQGRTYYEDKADAKAKAAEMEAKRQNPHFRFFGYPVAVQNSTMHALDMLEGREVELPQAVRFYLAHHAKEKRTLAAAIAECVEAKKQAGKRHRYIVALKNTLTRFAVGRESTLIHEITAKEIEMWINASWQDEKGEWQAPSVATRRSRQIDLGTLFSYAEKWAYVQKNPVASLEKHSYDEKTPSIITPDQCAAVLKEAGEVYGGDLLATVALQMFGGLRPYESYKIKWEDVKDDIIRLDGSKAKKRDIRNVEINPTLRVWLDHAKKIGARLPAFDGPRRMTAVRKAVQPWPQDCLRHSCVSYGLEKYGWESTVKNAGHSIAMMFDHYRALVTRQSAEAFWALRPI